MIQYKTNWQETIQRYDAWFHGQKTDRPLLNVQVYREDTKPFAPMPELPFTDTQDHYLNVDKSCTRVNNHYRKYEPVAEAFPQFSMNLGAGSMALYLGSEPKFAQDTIWFEPFLTDYQTAAPLVFNPNNAWWIKHIEMLRRQAELVKDTDIMVCIPDIVENLDILSAIRDPQQCCFDLYDYPEQVKAALDQLADVYMQFYTPMYDIVKTQNDVSAFTAFSILGTGKTAKIQCDISALISPGAFEELVIPGLRRQTEELDNTLFHLDGPECLVHVDALMKLERLGGLQWTTGARNEPGGSEVWFALYRTVRKAGKGVWIFLGDYTPEVSIQAAEHIVRTLGAEGMFFHFPAMERNVAEGLISKAEKEWKC